MLLFKAYARVPRGKRDASRKKLVAFIKLQSEASRARKVIRKDRGVMFAVYLSPPSHCVGEITWNLSCVIRSGLNR